MLSDLQDTRSSGEPADIPSRRQIRLPLAGNRRGGPRAKRYRWLCGSAVAALVFEAFLGAHLTGSAVFWWFGPILAFGVVPVLDRLVGADSKRPSDEALARVADDRFYRWVIYLYLPLQYLSLALACCCLLYTSPSPRD